MTPTLDASKVLGPPVCPLSRSPLPVIATREAQKPNPRATIAQNTARWDARMAGTVVSQGAPPSGDLVLLTFAVTNWRSIRDTATLDLRRPIRRRSAEAKHQAPSDVVNLAAVYGANASGKSSILLALSFMVDAVRDSFRAWPVEQRTPRQPFRLDNSSADYPTSFAIEFLAEDDNVYHYGFSLNDKVVTEEYLYQYRTHRRTVLFERKGASFAFGPVFRGPKAQVAETTRANALFLSTAASSNMSSVEIPFRWLSSQLWFYDARGTEREFGYIKDTLKADPEWKQQLLAFLSAADLGIVDLRVKRVPVKIDESDLETLKKLMDDEQYTDFLKEFEFHLALTHKGDATSVELPIELESSGTQRFLAFASVALKAFREGATCVVDEVDGSLHPMLVEQYVALFKDPDINPKKAQLIFSTHDVSLLEGTPEERVLQDDEVWLVEKDEHGVTEVVALSNYRDRRGNLRKGYLNGRFGATPMLSVAEEVRDAMQTPTKLEFDSSN